MTTKKSPKRSVPSEKPNSSPNWSTVVVLPLNAQAALSYLEAGGNKRFLEPVIKHFGMMPLARIDQDAIDQGVASFIHRQRI